MHDESRDEVVWRAHSPAQWLHDLRNGLNTAGVSMMLGRRLLARGDDGGAQDMLARAEHSLAECRELLATGDAVLGLDHAKTTSSPSSPPSGPQTAGHP